MVPGFQPFSPRGKSLPWALPKAGMVPGLWPSIVAFGFKAGFRERTWRIRAGWPKRSSSRKRNERRAASPIAMPQPCGGCQMAGVGARGSSLHLRPRLSTPFQKRRREAAEGKRERGKKSKGKAAASTREPLNISELDRVRPRNTRNIRKNQEKTGKPCA